MKGSKGKEAFTKGKEYKAGLSIRSGSIDVTATKKADKVKLITNYNNELLNYLSGKGSKVIEDLRQVGITGFGIEDTCIHFDIRGESVCNRRDKFGKYLVFKFRCHYEKGVMVIDENRAI